jgi:hypothetical protein
MRRFILVVLFIAALAAFAGVQSATAAPANPLGLFFDNSFTGIEDYYHPGALLVTGNCNRYDPRFAKARESGAEVIAYLNAIEVYDHLPCKLNAGFYMGDRESVPLWPYPRYGERVNWPKTHLADMRAGSAWVNHMVEYISDLMREGKVDGVFLDTVGARLWDRPKWNEWPKQEQDAWTEGNIDFVRRLDAARRKLNPNFIIVTNNVWDLGHGDKRGFEGEKYIDGIMLEHQKPNEYHQKYASHPFGDGGHRRLLVMALSEDDAKEWANVPGVTHVAWQTKYDHPGPPLVPFRALADRH